MRKLNKNFKFVCFMLTVVMVLTILPVWAVGEDRHKETTVTQYIGCCGECYHQIPYNATTIPEWVYDVMLEALRENPNISAEALQQIIGTESGIFIFSSESDMVAYYENKLNWARKNYESAKLNLEIMLAHTGGVWSTSEEILARNDEDMQEISPEIAEMNEQATQIIRNLMEEGVAREEVAGQIVDILRSIAPRNVRIFADNNEMVKYYKNNVAEAKVALEIAEITLEKVLASMEKAQSMRESNIIIQSTIVGLNNATNHICTGHRYSSWTELIFSSVGGSCHVRHYISHFMGCTGCPNTWIERSFVSSWTQSHAWVLQGNWGWVCSNCGATSAAR